MTIVTKRTSISSFACYKFLHNRMLSLLHEALYLLNDGWEIRLVRLFARRSPGETYMPIRGLDEGFVPTNLRILP